MSALHIHGVGCCALGADEPFVSGLGRLAEVPIKQYAKPARLRRYARLARLIYVASCRAIDDAGVRDPSKLTVVTGTALGELSASLQLVEQIRDKRGVGISPALVPNTVHNAPAGHLTIGIGAHTPAVTVSQGWLSAEAALVAARDLLELGGAELALVAVGDEADPTWLERLTHSAAGDWAQALEAEAFQEGAVALVVGGTPGGQRLGRVDCRVEHRPDVPALVREILEPWNPHSSRREVRLRHSAGSSELASQLTHTFEDALHVIVDGPGPGSSQAGAAWTLIEHLRDPSCNELVLFGSELGEIGALRWKR